MNIGDDDVDLALTLGSRNHHIDIRSKTSSGAGVNALSRVDLAFAESDSISELVWSPHNGLSLRCTDSSSTEVKPLFLWNVVGPSRKVLSSSATIRSKGSGDDEVVEEENLTALYADAEFGDKFTLVRACRSCPDPELGACRGHQNGMSEEESGTLEAQKVENTENYGRESLCSLQNVQLSENSRKNAFHRDPHITKISEALFSSPPNSPSQQEPYNEVTSEAGEMPKNEAGPSLPAPRLTKLEFSAENEFAFLNEKEVSEVRIAIPFERSQTNSRMYLYREKGKQKALSDGEDNSHETVESCNSVGLFPKGIKRRNNNQELIVGSKRMKMQNEGSRDSTSFIEPGSSFMKWMSNMVKGLSDFHKEESSPRPLSVAHPNVVYVKKHTETSRLGKDPTSTNKGFQTVFKSLYCQNNTLSNTGTTKKNDSVGDSKELVVAGKILTANSCERNDDDSCKQIMLINKDGNEHNETLDEPVCGRSRTGASLSDSLCKQVNSTEKDNPLASLWITRLYMRPVNSNRVSQEHSTDCLKENLRCQTNGAVSFDQRSSEGRDETQIHASKKDMCEFSIKAEAPLEFKSTHKIDPVLPSQKPRSSEAMAFVFAQQPDALRLIVPSGRMNSSTSCGITCFFCGRNGHDLRECLEVTETELEDLLIKTTSCQRMELESQSMCIRCFQLDHWAVSCPFASSNGYQTSDLNASIPPKLFTGKENCSSYLVSREKDHKLTAASPMAESVVEPCLCCSSKVLPWNAKQPLSKTHSTAIDIQKSRASNLQNYLKEGRNLPLHSFIAAEKSVEPVEIFQAIRKLRLSRADFLRQMNSNVPLSHLNGFFLRLRLGKLEAGCGRTGYYAACITGDTRQHTHSRSEKSILVDVGGIKSSVGSRYISNQDFLEEEIKAWLCRILETGGKIPSLDELNSKFDQRRNLGF